MSPWLSLVIIAVSGFSGNTSRATHRGDFNWVVRAKNGRLIHPVDPSAPLVIPDSHKNLYSVRHAQLVGSTVILWAQAGLLPYGDPELFFPFLEDKSIGLWLLPLLPPPQTHNGVYPIYAQQSAGHAQQHDYKDSEQGIVHGSTGLPFSVVSDNGSSTTPLRASTSDTFEQNRTDLLNNHHRLLHVSINRARSLDIDGIRQPPLKLPKIKCPICISSRATRHKRPSASTADTRSATGAWQVIYSDLWGKMQISSISRYQYFAVFACAWSVAKHCEFIPRNNHFVDAYRRFLATTGIKPQYIRTLQTDQGDQYINHPMQALLEEHWTNQVVCAKDEHYSVGTAQ